MASIQKRGDTYRVLIRRKGNTVSKTFPTKALAERWGRETEVAIDRKTFARGDDLTLCETVAEYKRRMAQMGKPVGRNKLSCIDRAASDLGHHRLADLTTDVLVTWVTDMKVKPSTRQQYVIFLRTVLVTAETLWDATPNMVAFEKAARFLRSHGLVSESDKRDRRVANAEVEAILAHIECVKIPLADILWFQMASAFRIGETCRLRWADLNEAERTIVIRQRKHPRKKSDEIAPLLGEAWEIVKRQPRGGEFIFPYEERSVGAAVTRAVARAELGDLHLHDLRHEAISRLFEQGYDITEVALCSGHKDLKMLQRYTHLRPRDLHNGPVAIRRLREQMAAESNVISINRAA